MERLCRCAQWPVWGQQWLSRSNLLCHQVWRLACLHWESHIQSERGRLARSSSCARWGSRDPHSTMPLSLEAMLEEKIVHRCPIDSMSSSVTNLNFYFWSCLTIFQSKTTSIQPAGGWSAPPCGWLNRVCSWERQALNSLQCFWIICKAL